jgi:integrase
MQQDKSIQEIDLAAQPDSWEPSLGDAKLEVHSRTDSVPSWPYWIAPGFGDRLSDHEVQPALEMCGESRVDREAGPEHSSMSLAEFVQSKFVPEYVSTRRLAGRAHFQSILKYVLTPEQVARTFETNQERGRPQLRSIPGWPYLGSLRLCDIDRDTIQHLTSTALKTGYSTQTVTHIRNVIRSIFAYAIETRCYTSKNPAALVSLPAMTRKELHALSLNELKQMMQMMRYPEKVIALFAIVTGMNVAEICGLQWKYINLSNDRHLVDTDWIPPRTIAVRKQSYRGEFGPVTASRKRFVGIPELLSSILRDLKNRGKFTGLQDFVLASRTGTPIYPENVAARRLKAIGKELDMPWLSWSVFHRTHLNLKSQFGRHLYKEFERVLPVNQPVIRLASQGSPQPKARSAGKHRQ